MGSCFTSGLQRRAPTPSPISEAKTCRPTLPAAWAAARRPSPPLRRTAARPPRYCEGFCGAVWGWAGSRVARFDTEREQHVANANEGARCRLATLCLSI